jgi:hypothetical protein
LHYNKISTEKVEFKINRWGVVYLGHIKPYLLRGSICRQNMRISALC